MILINEENIVYMCLQCLRVFIYIYIYIYISLLILYALLYVCIHALSEMTKWNGEINHSIKRKYMKFYSVALVGRYFFVEYDIQHLALRLLWHRRNCIYI